MVSPSGIVCGAHSLLYNAPFSIGSHEEGMMIEWIVGLNGCVIDLCDKSASVFQLLNLFVRKPKESIRIGEFRSGLAWTVFLCRHIQQRRCSSGRQPLSGPPLGQLSRRNCASHTPEHILMTGTRRDSIIVLEVHLFRIHQQSQSLFPLRDSSFVERAILEHVPHGEEVRPIPTRFISVRASRTVIKVLQ